MAHEVVMPRLGWNMEQGAVTRWLKQTSDWVDAGEILLEVESDKAVQEVEALESGFLRIPPDSPSPGQFVPVGTRLAYLLKEGEELPSQTKAGLVKKQADPEKDKEVTVEGSPMRIRPTISPRAARLAKALGVDWQLLKGSGRTGRIVERDIRLAAPPPTAPVSASSTSTIRRLTAEKMAASARTTAPVTLTTEVDATELVNLRKQCQQDDVAFNPSFTTLLARLVAHALTEYSYMNGRFEGETIVQPGSVNLAIAVDTERGLFAPVIQEAQAKSLHQIDEELTSLIDKARTGQLAPEQLQGGTFTLTNLGMYDIDAFTPIINLPECAVLGLGRITPKQVVIDAEQGSVAIRQMMVLSLTFDHRLVDGAPAARFLQRIKRLVEQPYLWLE